MRYLILFAVPLALAAQTAESGDKVTQALISEIQQLRLAIERSTLLGARTQLAVSQMQMQETTMARVTTQLNDARMQRTGSATHRKQMAESLRDMEEYRTRPDLTAEKKLQVEEQIRESKREIERADALETVRATQEGDLAAQFQAAQAQIAESRARISELERALDAAIQQLLKK